MNAAFGGLQLESLFMNDNGGILERERSFLLQTYNRYPVVLARGKGVFLYDLEGQRYLDLSRAWVLMRWDTRIPES